MEVAGARQQAISCRQSRGRAAYPVMLTLCHEMQWLCQAMACAKSLYQHSRSVGELLTGRASAGPGASRLPCCCCLGGR
jgi:hypothetical protein